MLVFPAGTDTGVARSELSNILTLQCWDSCLAVARGSLSVFLEVRQQALGHFPVGYVGCTGRQFLSRAGHETGSLPTSGALGAVIRLTECFFK